MVLIKIHPHASVDIFQIVLKDVTSTDIYRIVVPLNLGFPKGQLFAHYYFWSISTTFEIFLKNSSSNIYADQGPRKIDNWGGGGSYSYIRSLHDYFLLKSIVFMLSEHEYMNTSSPIIDLSRSLMWMVQSPAFKVLMLTNFHITMNGKEYFYHVSSTFEAVLCSFSLNVFPSGLCQIFCHKNVSPIFVLNF